MKHNWEEVSLNIAGNPVKRHWDMRFRWRVCRNCRAKQRYDTQYSWMRVVGYRWHPKVGRCKPNVAHHAEGGAR